MNAAFANSVDHTIVSIGGGLPGWPARQRNRRLDGGNVAGFSIGKCIGTGGTSKVYAATQDSGNQAVALKVLHGSFNDSADTVAAFYNEARLLGMLDHPAIVSAYETGEFCGRHYLAMERIEGETLEARINRDGPLPEAEAIRITAAVADAMAYAWHTCGLVHRDIKPANIMLDADGNVSLMDLGIAVQAGGDTTYLDMTGPTGTPHYMSPEQIRNTDELDARADIYSLGATLYHMLTGERPFNDAEPLGALYRALHETVPTAAALNPQVSRRMSNLVSRMMSLDADSRHRNWRALLNDLSPVGRLSPQTDFLRILRPLAAAAAAVVLGCLGAHSVIPTSAEQTAPQQLELVQQQIGCIEQSSLCIDSAALFQEKAQVFSGG